MTLSLLKHWIKERHQIYLKRRAGKPKPWTTDEILLDYKFCNPIRMNDRVSKWLMDNWYAPYRDHPNMLLACTLARQINTPDSLSEIGFPVVWRPELVQKKLEGRQRRGLKTYSAAYMITANFGTRGREKETKPSQTVWRVCQPIYESGRVDTNSMQKTWESLLHFQGFSSFIAGQVVADLRWALTGKWADKNTWAPMGPGSQRGLNRLYNRSIDHKLNQDEFLKELREMAPLMRKVLPSLEMMDCQNCLCEYDKYCRLLNGEGQVRSRYPGRK